MLMMFSSIFIAAILAWKFKQAAPPSAEEREQKEDTVKPTKRGKRKRKGSGRVQEVVSPASTTSRLSAAQVKSLEIQWRAILEGGCGPGASPGLSASVVLDGSLLFSGATGVVDREASPTTALTDRHVLHCASLAKVVVAAAVVQLEEEGKLKLEDAVCQHVPYFGLGDPVQWDHFDLGVDTAAQKVTIYHMLTHTGGIPDVHDDEYGWGVSDSSEGAAEAYVRSLREKEQMIGAPGHVSMYSNIAFNVLAHLIAKVSGQSFESYVKERIFQPLGMQDSTFFYPEVPQGLRSQGHDKKVAVRAKVYPYNRAMAGSSTLNSSARDMSRFMLAMLQGGVLDGRRFLSEAGVAKLWHKNETGRFFFCYPCPVESIGLAWFLGEHRSHMVVEHEGEDDGFCAYIVMVPELHAGVFLASNWEKTPSEKLAYRILNCLLDAMGCSAGIDESDSASSSSSSSDSEDEPPPPCTKDPTSPTKPNNTKRNPTSPAKSANKHKGKATQKATVSPSSSSSSDSE